MAYFVAMAIIQFILSWLSLGFGWLAADENDDEWARRFYIVGLVGLFSSPAGGFVIPASLVAAFVFGLFFSVRGAVRYVKEY